MGNVIESPYFTLMCEFEVGTNFEGFLDYISREEAKKSDDKVLSNNSDYEFENSKISIDQYNFFKYLNYMDRKTALESKTKLSKEELKSLQKVTEENKELVKVLKEMKESTTTFNPKEELQTGMFDFYKDDLSNNDLHEYKKRFSEAQKNNSVMYKDVISFKTEALITAGIYNPFTDELSRQPLIEASRKMLKQMYKDEGLEQTGISVGEIHYNTNHFHIHFATVETKNTRGTVVNKETGLVEPKGIRKESTLENMKSAFANYVFDRSEELAKISHLRDTLREEVKGELHSVDNNSKAIQYLSELKSKLPEDKKKWNSKNLSEENQGIMRKLTDELMKNNLEFEKYKQLAKEENDFKMQTYGKLPKGQTSFYEGRMEGKEGIYYRLGNSILAELRKGSSRIGYSKNILKEEFRKNPNLLKEQGVKVQSYGNKQTYGKIPEIKSESYQKNNSAQYQKKNKGKIISSNRSVIKQLSRLEKVTNNEFEKYKAELENQKIARDIRQAQYEQSFE